MPTVPSAWNAPPLVSKSHLFFKVELNAAFSTEPQNPFKMSDPETVVGSTQPICHFVDREPVAWGAEGAAWQNAQALGRAVLGLSPDYTIY